MPCYLSLSICLCLCLAFCKHRQHHDLLGAAELMTRACLAALVTAALGMASFSMCGLYCNHADLSPRHAPFLLGMTNTVGALPGIVGWSPPCSISALILWYTGEV